MYDRHELDKASSWYQTVKTRRALNFEKAIANDIRFQMALKVLHLVSKVSKEQGQTS